MTTATVTGVGVGSAQYTVAAEALTAGRILALAGTLTTIATPVSGWTDVTNLTDATPGTDTETDAPPPGAARAIAQRSASSPVDAIAAQVAEVSASRR